MCLLPSVKVMVVRERGGCDWEAELTLVTPGAGVATQSCQSRSEAGLAQGMLGKWFNLCLPGVWGGFPLL